jgi:hypothetical protein
MQWHELNLEKKNDVDLLPCAMLCLDLHCAMNQACATCGPQTIYDTLYLVVSNLPDILQRVCHEFIHLSITKKIHFYYSFIQSTFRYVTKVLA